MRFQAQHPKDQGVTGPYTYGKGRKHIDHTASSNRSLCVKTLQLLNMVEVASYRTPNPVHHITFKDKAAPPTDWSQFVLDPLIMQQFYQHLSHTAIEDPLKIAALVRSFLPLPEPLPPTQKTPVPDPIRFQRLDHTFTRAQWLPSVNSCRSKLHTGFPTDHYLLVTEVQIKLAQRSKPSTPKPKLNLSNPTETQKHDFNQALRDILDHTAQTPEQPSQPLRITFYTDGSGSRGKCSATTPAGWGWCAPQGEDWLEASGPVITSPDHTAYVGATVGSNNTGELTAIAEALLFAVEHEYTHVTIHTDSLWARNVISGLWKAKTNKALVHTAKRLVKRMGLHVQIHWIKGHAGHAGNEKADRLAEQGKLTAQSCGGRQMTLPPETTPPARTTPQHNLASAMEAAAKQVFSPYERRPRKPWISDHTPRPSRAGQKSGGSSNRGRQIQAQRSQTGGQKGQNQLDSRTTRSGPLSNQSRMDHSQRPEKGFRRRAKTSSCGR